MNVPRSLRSVAELVGIVAAALFFALVIQAYAVKPYVIPSESMLPTLHVGQRVLVDRISHRLGGDPKIGDVTVFMPPPGADSAGDQCGKAGEGPSNSGRASRRSCSQPTAGAGDKAFVKRIVGLPGDVIEIRDGHVIRNGRQASEPFTEPCGGGPECNLEPIVVAPDHYFLMGDNRGDSDDSRYWGPVQRAHIIGRARVTYWPPGRLGAN